MTLDLTGSRDRGGLWTYRHYNANQKMDSITDPANRTTQYGWCTCGALTSITDPKNQTTTFHVDIQGRVYQKVFANGTAINYLYDGQTEANGPGATSRLKSATNAKNQRTNYLYFADDNLQQVSYTNLAGQPLNPPTPSVSYTHDPNYSRVVTMTDGTGQTVYGYNAITQPAAIGAGRLASIDGPLLNDTVAFSYDELGRQLSEGVNGANRSQTYDVLGRVDAVTNPLGLFTNVYDGVSARLQSTTNLSGQTTTYSYYPNSGDHRLQTLTNLTANGSILSKFDYQYDPAGQITFLQKQLGPTGYPVTWTGADGGSMYDAADQLTSVVEQRADDLFSQSVYGYDLAGNRIADNGGSHTFDGLNQAADPGYRYDLNGNLTQDPGRTYEWDAANRLIAINYPGIGSRTEFAYNGSGHRVKTVEYQQNTAVWTSQFQPPDANYTFYSAGLTLPAGTYSLELRGLNPNGGYNTVLIDNVTHNGVQIGNGGFETPGQGVGGYVYRPAGASWTFTGESGVANQYVVDNPAPPEGTQFGFIQNTGSFWQPLTFATNSNTLSVTAAQWASRNTSAQRVVANIYAGSSPWSVAKVRQFIWIGERLAEERDGNNVLTRRYFPEGEQQIGVGAGYYTRDHLGSIREVIGTGGSNVLAVRYDYDAWGNRRKVEGAYDVDWGFTGHYYHATSGLYLAPYRAYDPAVGRWINRDPIGEAGGLNLYGYVENDPLNGIDPLGLFDVNLLPTLDRAHPWGDRTPILPNVLTIGGHGSPTIMWDSNRNPLPPQKLADIIKSNPKYDPNRPVKLQSCRTGAPTKDGTAPYAQQLADALGSPVSAPTGNVVINPSGDTWLKWGYYHTFNPSKK